MMNLKKIAVAIATIGVLGFGYTQYNHYSNLNNELNEVKITNNNNEVIIDNLTTKNEELLKQVEQLNQEKLQLQEQNTQLENDLSKAKRGRNNIVSRGDGHSFDVEATAYTMGGRTAIGDNLSGETWDSAMVIAVDPNIIPLGSQVRIAFHDEAWQHLNGVYTASDTGGAINGHIIDVFLGHGNDSEAMRFGRRTATVEIL